MEDNRDNNVFLKNNQRFLLLLHAPCNILPSHIIGRGHDLFPKHEESVTLSL